MKLLSLVLAAAAASFASAKSAGWAFSDGLVTVGKTGPSKALSQSEELSPSTPLKRPVRLGVNEKLNVVVVTTDAGEPSRPHQAFLSLSTTGKGGQLLQEAFPFTVKPSGRAVVEVTQQVLPTQFRRPDAKIDVSVIIGSFGSSTPYKKVLFNLAIDNPEDSAEVGSDGSTSPAPVRYAALPEIHHIFGPDPRSPPKIVSIAFTGAVVAILPIFILIWTVGLGANVDQLPVALRDGPISHVVFATSIVGLEATLVMYYLSWNLFQTLPVMVSLGVVALMSGSRALSEVQARRLKGKQ